MPWESAGEGIVRQIMGYNDNLMMVKVKFETGAIGTPHTHPHTQTTYVASGVFEFTTDGETKIVRPGDGVYMKPGILHGCICLEAGVLIGNSALNGFEVRLSKIRSNFPPDIFSRPPPITLIPYRNIARPPIIVRIPKIFIISPLHRHILGYCLHFDSIL